MDIYFLQLSAGNFFQSELNRTAHFLRCQDGLCPFDGVVLFKGDEYGACVATMDDNTFRIKDDCIPFDPKERNKLESGDDLTKNIGIRMIYKIMKDVNYQNLLGLNVLTVRI